ncbi:hypothetical protein R3P38DRAFT_3234503 [Favolaschia claudopus]|uniref:Uncharacterized protein n=1 Tax=Favolaschia claudopus TaxID=2862362 RepID=A0AAV9ZGF7_9AGAR
MSANRTPVKDKTLPDCRNDEEELEDDNPASGLKGGDARPGSTLEKLFRRFKARRERAAIAALFAAADPVETKDAVELLATAIAWVESRSRHHNGLAEADGRRRSRWRKASVDAEKMDDANNYQQTRLSTGTTSPPTTDLDQLTPPQRQRKSFGIFRL